MAFKKGQKKPAGSGMKKGQKTKNTIWLYEMLASVNLSWQEELKKAIEAKDYKMIELLQGFLPYLSPRIKEKEINPPTQQEQPVDVPVAELLQLVKGSATDGNDSEPNSNSS